MQDKKIRIATWNANGILSKRHELEVFLHVQNIDVCLVSETHLSSHQSISFRDYKVYSAIHPDNCCKCGTAVIVKNGIDHYEFGKLQKSDMQLAIVTINSAKQKFNVAALYCPPNCQIKKEIFKDVISQIGERFILGGDYNAKHTDWGSRLTLTRGRQLREVICDLGCLFHSSGKPTYWPSDTNKVPDMLDFFITKKVSENFISIEDNYDLSSDHSAVILTLSETIVKKANKPALCNATTDWLSFRKDLNDKIDLTVPLNTVEQLESAAEAFMQNIQIAAWSNSKVLNSRKISSKYPSHVLAMISEKRRARRVWQQSRHPDHKRILNNKTQTLSREIKRLRESSFDNYLGNLSATKKTNYSLWKATSKLKKPVTYSAPIRKTDGTWARSDKEKADVFADHLAEIFTPNDINSDFTIGRLENNFDTNINPITKNEIIHEIKKLKLNKAPGFDLITADILKNLPVKAITQLTQIMNAALKLRCFPSIWKIAEIIMIEKQGKPPNEAKSYRPISLLPTISKLFEKLLLKRIQPFFESCNAIPSHQFGFREKHSTIDQVHRITNIIEKALEEKKICSAVFLDVAQAFDKVWHQGLAHKLNRFLPKGYVEILESYLLERTFRVKQGNEYSALKEIKAGVPQGSILGPILYLIYTSDIPQIENVILATFADDTSVMAVGSNIKEATDQLQAANDEISDWCLKWKIKLNETKSTHVNFTNRKIEAPPVVKLNNVVIPHGNKAKYLGMTLDTKLRWKEHVKLKKQELECKYRNMYWLIGRRSKLSTYNKVLIYNQVLKPVWTYGIQLWGCAKLTHLQSIQKFQNKVLRNILSAPWYVRNSDIHRDLKTPTVKDVIKNFALKHKIRLNQHVNVEASSLLHNQNSVRRLKRTKPLELSEN